MKQPTSIEQMKEKINGHFTPAEARAILEAEAQAESKRVQKEMQRFNDGLVSLVKETGYAVAPALIYPNGEIVLLASYLKAHNFNLQPTIQIVKANG